MIKNKADLIYYLECDRIALGRTVQNGIANLMRRTFFPDLIWKFQRTLRKTEYFMNRARPGIGSQLSLLFYKIRFRKLSIKLGFTIPPNVFGPGLSIAHYGTIVVNANTKIGKNCRIHTSVNIGAASGQTEAPTLGDNIYIGPGAVIYGNINLRNNIVIGAQALVNQSFEEEGVLIAGVPARVVSKIDIREHVRIVGLNPETELSVK